jgi:hypothetical protein
MNPTIWADMPLGCPFVIDRMEGAIRIECPAKGLDWIVVFFLGILGSILPFMTVVAVINWSCDPKRHIDILALIVLAVFSVLPLIIVYLPINDMVRRTTLKLDDACLSVAASGVFLTARREWPRSQIRAIRPGWGLRIVGTPSLTVLRHRPRDEIRWLAECLCGLLHIDNTLPRSPGEVEVSYTANPLELPVRGFLSAEAGKLRLRYYAVARADFTFYNSKDASALAWLHVAANYGPRTTVAFLATEDVMCHFDEDGTACLRIKNTRPLPTWPTLLVTVWCADKDALHAALARFWGATDD